MNRRYVWITHNGKSALEHVVVAERAIGKELPSGAEVHHVDGNGLNNDPSNLVICPSKDYHKLLHVRQRALEASGNPESRKCHFCKKWDVPSQMRLIVLNGSPERYEHGECQRRYQRDRFAKLKLKVASVAA